MYRTKNLYPDVFLWSCEDTSWDLDCGASGATLRTDADVIFELTPDARPVDRELDSTFGETVSASLDISREPRC